MGDDVMLAVVLVEDSAYFADLTMRILKRSGLNAKFRVVSTRAALLATLNEEQWDIIISDNMIPGLSALDVLDIKNKICCSTHFIIVSEDICQKELQEAVEKGCNYYLLKDRINELPDLIHQTLHKAES